jgi:hypothetical protein
MKSKNKTEISTMLKNLCLINKIKLFLSLMLLGFSLSAFSKSFYLECELKEKEKVYTRTFYHVNLEKNEFRDFTNPKLKYVMIVEDIWINATTQDEKYKIKITINRLNQSFSFYFNEYIKDEWVPTANASGSCKKTDKLKV